MKRIDWAIVVAYIAWIVVDGLRRSKGTAKMEGYFLGNRSLPWWAIGLSVMATQMSAVTLVGTTGQAYLDRLTVHPVLLRAAAGDDHPVPDRRALLSPREGLYRLRYLERRFDVRTRSLASFLFLMGRAFSLGVTLSAPAVVMSTILGWTLPVTVFVICIPMILYTSFGGVQAVAWTDVKQMFIIVGGLLAAVVVLIVSAARRQPRPGDSPGG